MSAAHQMAIETQQELRRLPGNNRCVDCDAPYPQWATVSYGTFMCLECSGRHRGLGVHISFVRSVTMDSWTDKQILQMQRGGNDTFREAFAAAGVPTTLSITQKYNTPQAEAYRARLTALVEGRSATPLPRWDPSTVKPTQSLGASSFSNGGGAGGDTRGVEALKGETEADYVARQLQLREEARARMAAKFGNGGLSGIGSSGESRAPANNGGIADLSGAFGFLTSTVASAASTAVSLVKDQDLGTKVSSGWSYVQSTLGDPALTQNVKATATTGWSTLAGGATAVWQKAVNAPPANGNGEVPRFNGSLAPSGKYSGVGNDNFNGGRDHDNDSWLDAQLNSTPPKANSFNGSSSSSFSSAPPAHSASFSSSSSSSASSSFGMALKPAATSSAPTSYSSSSSSSSSSFSTPPPAPLSTPLPAPVAAVPKPAPAPPAKEKKKDVDFFAEFGF